MGQSSFCFAPRMISQKINPRDGSGLAPAGRLLPAPRLQPSLEEDQPVQSALKSLFLNRQGFRNTRAAGRQKRS